MFIDTREPVPPDCGGGGGPVSILGRSPNIMDFLIAIISYLFCISCEAAEVLFCNNHIPYRFSLVTAHCVPQYFYKVIRQLLPMAYNLLKRSLFAEILEAHLTSRSHDNLDQLAAQ